MPLSEAVERHAARHCASRGPLQLEPDNASGSALPDLALKGQSAVLARPRRGGAGCAAIGASAILGRRGQAEVGSVAGRDCAGPPCLRADSRSRQPGDRTDEGRGQVRSVRRIEDETEICLDHPVDSGSSYDIGKLEDPECWRGIVEGRLPASRDCVTLQIQGRVRISTSTKRPAADSRADPFIGQQHPGGR